MSELLITDGKYAESAELIRIDIAERVIFPPDYEERRKRLDTSEWVASSKMILRVCDEVYRLRKLLEANGITDDASR